MDVERIRRDFPILESGIVYLDNGASTLTPSCVVEKIAEYYNEYRANIHRGVHRLSRTASERFEEAREKVAGLIGALPEETVFTKNTTEGINLAALSLSAAEGKRKKIVTTVLEHHSNLLPWLRLKKHGFRVEVVDTDPEGFIDPESIKQAVDPETLAVAVTHASNILGSINPVKEIGGIARDNGAFFLVDGAQSVPHFKVGVKEIGCDFMAFSAHKMLGPTGVGALYIRKEIAEKMEPAVLGGGTISNVSLDHYKLAKPPARWEAGTPNIAGAIGFGEAVSYLDRIGFEGMAEHERVLLKRMFEGLESLDNVKLYYRDAGNRIGSLPFNIGGMDANDAARLLDERGIMTRSGHHCAMPLMKGFLGTDSCVRASLYVYNTREEVERFISSVGEISSSRRF